MRQDHAEIIAGQSRQDAGLRQAFLEQPGKTQDDRVTGFPSLASPAIEAGCEEFLRAFDADPLRSRPLGFYTWSEELQQIFRCSRLLQRGLEESSARRLAGSATSSCAAPAIRRSP